MVYVQEELLEVFIYKHTPKYIAKKVQKKKVQRSLLKGLPFILILVASSFIVLFVSFVASIGEFHNRFS